MASTTSLTVASAPRATALIRASDQDSAAKRRLPVMATLSMLRGACSGRTVACELSPSLASLSSVGTSPTASTPACTASPGSESADRPGDRRGRSLPEASHGGVTSRASGSVDRLEVSSRVADMPSISAWCSLV